MSAPRLVVFDVDGTLLDSGAVILAAMGRAFAAASRETPARPAVLGIVGLSLAEAMRALVPDAAADEVAALAEGYRAAVVALRAETGGEAAAPLYPGARACLDRLAADPLTLLGIATGKARRGLDHMLAGHGLGRHFQTLQTADLHPSKPHPAMLLACLAETGVAADRAVMVGDSTYDMEMARAAGLLAIGVGWGFQPADRLRAAGAHRVVADFAALEAVLAAEAGA